MKRSVVPVGTEIAHSRDMVGKGRWSRADRRGVEPAVRWRVECSGLEELKRLGPYSRGIDGSRAGATRSAPFCLRRTMVGE